MEEQITEKQFKTIKAVRGCLKAIFILLIIYFATMGMELALVAAIPQVGYAMQQALGTLLFSSAMMIGMFVTATVLLYSKSASRKKIVSAMMFVYSLLFTAYGVSFFFIAQQTLSYIYTIGIVFFNVSNAVFIILSVMLLRKVQENPIASQHVKKLFILYVVLVYISDFLFISALSTNMSYYMVVVIALGIAIGLGNILGLAPQFALYKGISDDVFYQNFIVANPNIAIRRYEASKFRPAAQQREDRFCSKCGAALEPGANFCRICGNKIGS